MSGLEIVCAFKSKTYLLQISFVRKSSQHPCSGLRIGLHGRLTGVSHSFAFQPLEPTPEGLQGCLRVSFKATITVMAVTELPVTNITPARHGLLAPPTCWLHPRVHRGPREAVWLHLLLLSSSPGAPEVGKKAWSPHKPHLIHLQNNAGNNGNNALEIMLPGPLPTTQGSSWPWMWLEQWGCAPRVLQSPRGGRTHRSRLGVTGLGQLWRPRIAQTKPVLRVSPVSWLETSNQPPPSVPKEEEIGTLLFPLEPTPGGQGATDRGEGTQPPCVCTDPSAAPVTSHPGQLQGASHTPTHSGPAKCGP